MRTLTEVVEEGHRRAGHGGRWDECRDPVCAAVEEWLHDRMPDLVNGWATERLAAIGASLVRG